MAVKEAEMMDREGFVTPAEDGRVPIPMIANGALIGSLAYGAAGLIVGAAWQWAWGWVAVVMVAAAVPFILLGSGMVGLVVRGSLSWALEPKREIEVVHTDTQQAHIVPMTSRRTINGVAAEDLEMFIRQSLPVGDWTQRRWRSTVMASGRTCDTRYHASIMDVLVAAGVIEGYGKGSSGWLARADGAEIGVDEALHKVGIK